MLASSNSRRPPFDSVAQVVEPWMGEYTDTSLTMSDRSNYAMREAIFELRTKKGFTNTITTMTCVGANPGLVSWLLKDALLALARELGHKVTHEPTTREEWAAFMQSLGVKVMFLGLFRIVLSLKFVSSLQGVHIAERDTQRGAHPKPIGTFVNTWSVNGFVSEVN
jgi:homospermidine synthase